jgi:hypothetical protein
MASYLSRLLTISSKNKHIFLPSVQGQFTEIAIFCENFD